MVCLYSGICILVCMWYVSCIDAPHGDLRHLVCIDIIKKWLRRWIHCLKVGRLNQSFFCSYNLWWWTWWNPLEVHDISHCFENMGVNQGVQNFLEWVFEPCSMNMPKTKEHDELRKASPKYENNKKNSTYEHCNVPKANKNYSSDPFMCFSGKSFLQAMGIGFLRKWILERWGSVFSRNPTYNGICFLEKHHLGKLFPRGIVFPICSFRKPPPIFSRGDLALCSLVGSYLKMW